MKKCEELPVVNGLHECRRCNAFWNEDPEDPTWKPFKCPERSGWNWNYPMPSARKVGDVWQSDDGTVFATVEIGKGRWGMELHDLPVKEAAP
jgi:hypothetical protein